MTNFLKLLSVLLIAGGIACDAAVHHGNMSSPGVSLTVIALIAVVVFFITFLPALVAARRRHQHTLAILVLSVVSFLIGLAEVPVAMQDGHVTGLPALASLIGWAVGLVWACMPVSNPSRIRLERPTH